jgi:hypothetical protein
MAAVGTARLTSDILAQRAVGASISRSQITEVLRETDGAPELVLDLLAEERGEHATISMTWSRDDLEQLLDAAPGDDVALVFDRDELASAFSDVDAHGMRMHAAVFTVAAVGALGYGASIANATVAGGEGAGNAAATAASTAAEVDALRARSEALNEEYGLGAAGNAAELDALRARSEALNEEYGLGAAGNAAELDALRARSEALNEEYGLGAAGNAAEVDALRARSEALNEEYGLGAAVGGPSDPAVRALELRGAAMNAEYGLGGAEATDSSAGVTIDRPTADDALLVGGLLLTIAGATFVVRRGARGRPA